MLLEFRLHLHDSVVYFTDIQILDSAKISKDGFLAHRELYSYRLKNYLEDNRLQQNSTCMIYFSENRKKLEKEATKILSKYKRSNRIIVTRVDSEKFRFTKPGRVIKVIFTHNNILIVNVIGDADLHLLFFYLCAVINEKYYEKD